MLLSCAFLAALPDIDVLFGSHRGPTHSLGAALLVAACAAAWARQRRMPALRIGTACGVAYSSHLLLDWLGKDTAPPFGIMALWPWSSAYYSSGANLFLEISRRYWNAGEFIAGNLRSVAWELILLAPIALLCYWIASMASATPFPPPRHNAATPRRAWRRRSS
jgi:LexA-binding, inner membrane-associated putative hydrolase